MTYKYRGISQREKQKRKKKETEDVTEIGRVRETKEVGIWYPAY
jgi:hypothetical protein